MDSNKGDLLGDSGFWNIRDDTLSMMLSNRGASIFLHFCVISSIYLAREAGVPYLLKMVSIFLRINTPSLVF